MIIAVVLSFVLIRVVMKYQIEIKKLVLFSCRSLLFCPSCGVEPYLLDHLPESTLINVNTFCITYCRSEMDPATCNFVEEIYIRTLNYNYYSLLSAFSTKYTYDVAVFKGRILIRLYMCLASSITYLLFCWCFISTIFV